MYRKMLSAKIATLLLASFIVLGACSKNKSADSNASTPTGVGGDLITIQHESGETVLKLIPKRIVVLEYSFIDALAAISIAPVGIADDKKRERIVPELTKHIGNDWVSVGTRKQPSLEVIASLTPDLIIADKKRHSAVYSSLSEIAPTIVLSSLGADYDATIKNMVVIGKALGKESEMEARIVKHQQIMDGYAASIQNPNNLTAVFGVTNANGLWLQGPISFNGSLLKRLGYDSPLKNNENASIETSLEQLADANPDILLFGKYTDPAFTEKFPEDALWQTISAVQNDEVHYVRRSNLWARLRGIIAAEIIAKDFVEILNK